MSPKLYRLTRLLHLQVDWPRAPGARPNRSLPGGTGVEKGHAISRTVTETVFPTRPQAAPFLFDKHGRSVKKQYPENWAGPHLVVKTTPQRKQSYPSPLSFGAPMLFTPSRSRSPQKAPPLRAEGRRSEW